MDADKQSGVDHGVGGGDGMLILCGLCSPQPLPLPQSCHGAISFGDKEAEAKSEGERKDVFGNFDDSAASEQLTSGRPIVVTPTLVPLDGTGAAQSNFDSFHLDPDSPVGSFDDIGAGVGAVVDGKESELNGLQQWKFTNQEYLVAAGNAAASLPSSQPLMQNDFETSSLIGWKERSPSVSELHQCIDSVPFLDEKKKVEIKRKVRMTSASRKMLFGEAVKKSSASSKKSKHGGGRRAEKSSASSKKSKYEVLPDEELMEVATMLARQKSRLLGTKVDPNVYARDIKYSRFHK